mmetsp:Transcript_8912/g.26756  ORF Transcript_8912/g.26756 Transcript_8912/m.26756 type:complete len:766 (-) Transcript_8912:334-2631(-)
MTASFSNAVAAASSQPMEEAEDVQDERQERPVLAGSADPAATPLGLRRLNLGERRDEAGEQQTFAFGKLSITEGSGLMKWTTSLERKWDREPGRISPQLPDVPVPPNASLTEGLNVVLETSVINELTRIPKMVRRPLLHALVLFASDPKVMKYAQEVQMSFISSKIDVFLQTEVSDGTTSQLVKPEHLSDIIATSRADYLIVLGDRNMRNRSCQAKEGGRLVEMSVDARAASILSSWEEERMEELKLLRCMMSRDPIAAAHTASFAYRSSGRSIDPVNPNIFTLSRRDFFLSHFWDIKGLTRSMNQLYSILEDAREWNVGHNVRKRRKNPRKLLRHHGCSGTLAFRDCRDGVLTDLLMAQRLLVDIHKQLVLAYEDLVDKTIADVGSRTWLPDHELPSVQHKRRLLSDINEGIERLEHVGGLISDECETAIRRMRQKMMRNVSPIVLSGLLEWKRYRSKWRQREPNNALAGFAGNRDALVAAGGWICQSCGCGNEKRFSFCRICEEHICPVDATQVLEAVLLHDDSTGVLDLDMRRNINYMLQHELNLAEAHRQECIRTLAKIFGSNKTSSVAAMRSLTASPSPPLVRQKAVDEQATLAPAQRQQVFTRASERRRGSRLFGDTSAELLSVYLPSEAPPWTRKNIWEGEGETLRETRKPAGKEGLVSSKAEPVDPGQYTFQSPPRVPRPTEEKPGGAAGTAAQDASKGADAADVSKRKSSLEALAAASDAARGGTGALTAASLAAVSAVLDSADEESFKRRPSQKG